MTPWRLLIPLVAIQSLLVAAFSVAGHMPFRLAATLALCLASISLWLGSRMIAQVHDEDRESLQVDRMRSDLRQKTDALSQEREELATLMSAISDGILAVDEEGRPLFYNTRFALLFYDRNLKGKDFRLGEVFRDPVLLEAFQGALKRGESRQVELPLFVRSQLAQRYFSLSVAPLRRDGKPVYGAVGVFHDVTELKRAERIRIEFVANVSHELRTPLTAIKGYVDTLSADFAAGRMDMIPKFVEIITRNADRLMRLIEDLLDLSSLESADGALTKTRVDTRELTEKVLGQFEPKRQEKKQTIAVAYEAEAVLGNASRLEQVLVNLLENAIKYVPAGGRIEIQWLQKGAGVELRVKDNGPGIPAAHLPRLFERFYRVDQARSRELGGTGLGLAIVKHILQSHGGVATVQSELGRGTEFICVFPEDAASR